MVESDIAEQYLQFVTANYESSMMEGHITRYGNLDRLVPVGYTSNFSIVTPTGIIADPIQDRPLRLATWQISPRKFCVVAVRLYVTEKISHVEPQKDHAVVMARFTRDIMSMMG